MRIIQLIVNETKGENIVDIFNNNDLKDAKENYYDVIIELPFLNIIESNNKRKYLNHKFNYEYKNQFFTFANSTSIFDVFKIKLENINKIKITNIASNFYSNLFYFSGKIPLYDNIIKYFNLKLDTNSVSKNKITIDIDLKKEKLNKKFGKPLIKGLVDLIKNNQELKEQLFFNFIKSKEDYIWANKNKNVSLTSGKNGYYTVKLIPPMKQREE